MTPVRVVIAEDHGLVRAGLRHLVEELPGFEVVAEAADGREAVEMVATHRPDVALLDLSMPGLDGTTALARIRSEAPGVRVLVVSMHDQEPYVFQALASGAAGYLLKDASPAELELALRAVARGGSYLSPAVSRHVVRDYVRLGGPAHGPSEGITHRQREILRLIAEGRSNPQIAAALGVSVKTVQTHRGHLMERLDIHDIAGLVRFAVRSGLVDGGG